MIKVGRKQKYRIVDILELSKQLYTALNGPYSSFNRLFKIILVFRVKPNILPIIRRLLNIAYIVLLYMCNIFARNFFLFFFLEKQVRNNRNWTENNNEKTEREQWHPFVYMSSVISIVEHHHAPLNIIYSAVIVLTILY